MKLLWEVVQFLFYTGLIVVISKYVLVRTLRSLAENLKLKPKTVGDIAGVATSVPELLTISASSLSGLNTAGIYNIISSNVINLIQYFAAILLNKNQKVFRNKAIFIDVILVIITIVLPILVVEVGVEVDLKMVPILLLLYVGFVRIDRNAHKLYLKDAEEANDVGDGEDVEDVGDVKDVEDVKKTKHAKSAYKKGQEGRQINKKAVAKNICILIITAVLLFFVGELLGNTLENLCREFNVPELMIGIILGFATSIPELITFFEAQKHHSKEQNNIHGVVEATNNLLTSNMMNLFIIQSIGILIANFA